MAAIAAPLAVAAPRRADSSLASTSRIACRALLQRSIAALNTRRPALAAATPRTAPLVQAAQTYLGDAPPGTTGNKLALELPTADLQRSVQFTALRRPSPRGTAILVASVEPGSASAAAGVKPGLELLGLSDPVRVNEVWPLSNGLTSLKYVRQTIEGRGAQTINVELSTAPAPEYLEALKEAGADATRPLSEAEQAATLAALESMLAAVEERRKAVRQSKIDERNNYYETDIDLKEQNNVPLFAAAIALFVGLPLLVVAGAVSSGYLTGY